MNEEFLTIQLLGDRKLLRDIEAIPDDVRLVVHEKVKTWTTRLRDLVVSNIEQRLIRKTGKLEDNVEMEIVQDGLRVEGRVFIHGVPYAKAQEKGAIIPPHIIRARQAKVLAFMAASGNKVFALHVMHPGATIPASNFMKDAYREMSPKVTNGLYYQIVRKLRNRLRRSGGG